jgi:hypothetical protein
VHGFELGLGSGLGFASALDNTSAAAGKAKLAEFANPPDYNNLKEEERYKPKQLSQEEMLLLERSVAQTKLEAEMTQLEVLNNRARLLAMANGLPAPQNSDHSASSNLSKVSMAVDLSNQAVKEEIESKSSGSPSNSSDTETTVTMDREEPKTESKKPVEASGSSKPTEPKKPEEKKPQADESAPFDGGEQIATVDQLKELGAIVSKLKGTKDQVISDVKLVNQSYGAPKEMRSSELEAILIRYRKCLEIVEIYDTLDIKIVNGMDKNQQFTAAMKRLNPNYNHILDMSHADVDKVHEKIVKSKK